VARTPRRSHNTLSPAGSDLLDTRPTEACCTIGFVSLFDRATRTDGSPAAYTEDSFTFLNRAAGEFWERIRVELDAWFADYETCAPPQKAADLLARFRRADPRQHLPAWWELYLFRLLRLAVPTGTVEPEPERSSAATAPDFMVTGGAFGRAKLYVEAVQPVTGIADKDRNPGREAPILDAINEIDNRNFFVHVAAIRVGQERPKKTSFIEPIEVWLGTLDPDRVQEDYERSRTLPRQVFRGPNWEIELRAIPRAPGKRSRRARLIGMGPMTSGYVNDVADVRSALARKRSHYGELDGPFIVAVMPSFQFEFESAAEVLYGSQAISFPIDDPESAITVRKPDGFWAPGSSGVSAALVGPGVLPWTIAKTAPTLWLNPFAAHSLSTNWLPVPYVHVDEDGRPRIVHPRTAPAALFRLPEDWPGPEPRFA
jgi:hypothetical protein